MGNGEKGTSRIPAIAWKLLATERATVAAELRWLAERSLQCLSAGINREDWRPAEPPELPDGSPFAKAVARAARARWQAEFQAENDPAPEAPKHPDLFEGMAAELFCLLDTLQELAVFNDKWAHDYRQAALHPRIGRPAKPITNTAGLNPLAALAGIKMKLRKRPGRPSTWGISGAEIYGLVADHHRLAAEHRAPAKSDRGILREWVVAKRLAHNRRTVGIEVDREVSNLQKMLARYRRSIRKP
ncbi:hypothetical protein [Azohydromonas aeria]|uniref:hypothetical protein n=1 Tax=Azohydromonas aeria TaxID=2590212 RepID=UPI0012FB7908|nr:hypothetical protein [Azohydromonas aeria]